MVDPRRRRGSRERGRPRAGRRVRHARGDQLHGAARARPRSASRSPRSAAAQLGLPPMVAHNRSQHGTNFTVSIEAAEGVTTGISAADRARTVRVAIAADSEAVRPRAARAHLPGGRAARRRARRARGIPRPAAISRGSPGLTPAAVICEIMKDDGTMARLPDLLEFAQAHGLQDRHDRRPDPLPQPHRAADRARRRAAARDRLRRLPADRLSRQAHATRRTSRWCAGRSRRTPRRWCACTSRCR